MYRDTASTLFAQPSRKVETSGRGSTNLFVHTGLKDAAVTKSGNGALKYVETDNAFVTQFGSMSAWLAPRKYNEVSKDMSTLWAIDPELAVRFTFYTRMVTRKTRVNGSVTEAPQRGQGLKNEGLLRLLWIGVNHPTVFQKNAWLIPTISTWKTVIDLLRHDLLFNGEGWNGRKLNWDFIAHMISEGLKSDQKDLVKKYLPSIVAKSACKTPHKQANHAIGTWLANSLFSKQLPMKQARNQRYRQLKSSGKAHTWQQALSTKDFDGIDFNKISGRALHLLAKGKFMKNHDMVAKYENWLGAKPAAKFTGYTHELFSNIPTERHKIMTLNKQFLGLVEKARVKDATNKWLAVMDTSSSMNSQAYGTKQSSMSIARGLTVFMSHLLPKGVFSGTYMTFDDRATLYQLTGSTPLDQYNSIQNTGWGSTNFQAIGNRFVQMKRQGVPEADFPTGIVCFSDNEFNKTSSRFTSNFDAIKQTLRKGGFSDAYLKEFCVVLWDIRNSFYGGGKFTKFESYSSREGGLMYFSGFDASVLGFLMGEGAKVIDPVTGEAKRPRTPLELFNVAMNQEVLNLVKI